MENIMSLISKQIDELRAYAKDSNGELAKLISDAADTIEVLSAKLSVANMERSSQYYNDGWISCSERLPEPRTDMLECFADLYDAFEDYSKGIINGLHRRFEELRKLSAKLYAKSMEHYNDGWIPVDDKLPNNDDAVLISHKNGVTKAWWTGKLWTSATQKYYKTVSAWMPLPEPYKPKEKNNACD
jgi:hypothetical protein